MCPLPPKLGGRRFPAMIWPHLLSMCVLFVFFFQFFNWVRALVLLVCDASSACVLDLVLCYGAVSWGLFLFLLVWCLWVVFVDWSTLGTDGVDNWGIWGFSGVIYLVFRVLFLVYRITLKLDGTSVVVVVTVLLDAVCCNSISSPPFLLS